LYRTCDGGAVIVNMIVNLFEEEDILTGDAEKIEMASKLALNYRNKTLSIFIMPRASERLKFVLREHLGNMTLLEIIEDVEWRKLSRKKMTIPLVLCHIIF